MVSLTCGILVNVTRHTELQLYECTSGVMDCTSLDTVRKTRFSWAETWRLNSEFSESSPCVKTVEIKCATNSPTSFPNYISNSFKAEFRKLFYNYVMLYVACTKYGFFCDNCFFLYFFPLSFFSAHFVCILSLYSFEGHHEMPKSSEVTE